LYSDTLTYAGAKALSHHYQQAKAALTGPDGPFSGWIKLDLQYQQFTINGECHDMPELVS
jgi:tRNA-specific adenosine deaminase 1